MPCLGGELAPTDPGFGLSREWQRPDGTESVEYVLLKPIDQLASGHGRADQCHAYLPQRREALALEEHAQARPNVAREQRADREPDLERGIDAGDAETGVGDAGRAANGRELLQRPAA